MIALFDFEPSRCPSCGRLIVWDREKRIAYFRDHKIMHCGCKFCFQLDENIKLVDHSKSPSSLVP
jgi:hypothetical protein